MICQPRLYGLGLTLLLIVPVGARAGQAPPATAPSAQCDCFKMQFLLRLPSLESQRLIDDVAALRTDLETGTPPTPAKIKALRQEADALRQIEEQDYGRLTPLLAKMGAPKILRDWADQSTKQLAQPVTMTAEEAQLAKTDPDTADLLATIDECDTLRDGTESQISDIAAWLHLSYADAGIWAADVGEVSASLQASDASGQPTHLETDLAHRLVASAPAGTPQNILTALNLLIMPSGNLSSLAASTSVVPVTTATQAHDALLQGFAAPSLADLTLSPPAPNP